MPSHRETKILPYTPQQLFDLVADVERYPEFLPWCKAARVSEKNADSFLGELIINYKGLSESYSSRVRLFPHHAIDVVMEEGPFEYLTNNWRFTPDEAGQTTKTQVNFALDFKFRSKIMEKMLGSLFMKANEKMMKAFAERAEKLYH